MNHRARSATALAEAPGAARDGGRAAGGAPPPYLRIERLTKRFGAFTAVQDVSLEIAEGEFVCFLGPSGCGKTTLLRAIAGLDLQSEGRIFQAGREISALPPAMRDFGIVFQSYALFPNLTVRRNVGYGLENQGLARREIDRRVDELLALVGLPEQGAKHPAQLSGGQQQRVALARALATSPGLLLLDEPLSALDAKVRVHLRNEVRELHDRLGVTTIMVTHDQEEALTMADRIVVMDRGRIEQVGTPAEVYCEPASAFVADFIGTMNFLAGEATDDGRVRVGGTMLACSGAPPPGPVTVAIRPEDVLIRKGGTRTDDALPATVHRIEFLGSFIRAHLELGRDRRVALRVDLPVNLTRDLGLAEGGSIRVALPPDRVRIYPAGNAHGDAR